MEVDKIYSKNESSVCETVKNKKEICAGFAMIPQTANVRAAVPKCLVKMEKALHSHNMLKGTTFT